MLPRVRESFPEAWFVGEVIHGDYARIVGSSTMDSLIQYELWKAVWSSLLDENFVELDWCPNRHNAFLDSFVPLTFVGNHDVTRIATRIGDAKASVAAAVLFTVGGIPSVCYGDEQAFRGLKTDRVVGDDEVRPALPRSPEGLSPLGSGFAAGTNDSSACAVVTRGSRRRVPSALPWTTGPSSTTPSEVKARGSA